MHLKSSSADLFSLETLRALADAAGTDGFVARHRTLANFRLGFHNSDTGAQAWLHITEQSIEAGVGDEPCAFSFSGDQAAFDDLLRGFPFNRLVRQHRLHVQGDLRSCVQNWLIIYAITRLTAELES